MAVPRAVAVVVAVAVAGDAMMRQACGLLLLVVASLAQAEERITAFESTLAIQADGTLQVTEAIRAFAEGNQIKRGIFRDFPTDYRDNHGTRVQVAFDVTSVTRDGSPEKFFTERKGNGVRLYIGDKDVTIPPGEHAYVIRYRTTRQIGFFDEHDELYWNVTGNGWIFPIEAASADVTLPTAVPAAKLRMEGWTGYQGSTGKAIEASVRDGGGFIRAKRALGPEEGLTLALSFPKGLIGPPSAWRQLGWWASDNRGVFATLLGFFGLWIFYLQRWWRFGRDPAAGVVMPEYEAPDNLPPSVLRYVRDMKFDPSMFVSDLMHLAQRGYVRITNDTKFQLEKLREPDMAEPIGAALMAGLFSKQKIVKLETGAHKVLGSARGKHKRALEAGNAGRWFERNDKTMSIGILVSTVAMAVGIWLQRDPGEAIPGTIAALILATAAAIGVRQLWIALRSEGWASFKHVLGALFALAIAAAAGLALAVVSGTILFAAIAGLALTNPLFTILMRAYTAEGRKLVDRIEGFTNYLAVAEKDDLARMKAPPMTGEVFAKFLPYAQALGVEKAWADKLVDALGEAGATEAMHASINTWYPSRTALDRSPHKIADDLGSSFSSAISSASTPPGSSSGGSSGGSSSSGGGGGSSGGGGGGGGGGGW